MLVRRGLGIDADRYALTTHNLVHDDPARIDRVRVEAVHDAWSVLGHHLRRVYELVAYHGLTSKADVYAAARLPARPETPWSSTCKLPAYSPQQDEDG